MTKLLRAQGEAGWDRKAALKRTAAGTAAALGSMLVLTVALVPLRASLTVATSALILIVPVVIGVVVGGFPAGVISVIVGFLVYDVSSSRPTSPGPWEHRRTGPRSACTWW